MPVSFPGLSHILRWSFTLSHGITPSVCRVDVAPQSAFPSEVGNLALPTEGGTVVFTGCAVDRAAIRRAGSGTLVSLAIVDRRWRWRFGSITGWYNLRDTRGELVSETQQSPRQLAGLLLDALGESNYSTVDLPNDVRPEVRWDHHHPAVELDRLCELLGCRVVLGIDDRIALRQVGSGALLPDLGIERRESVGIDPPARPGAIRVVGDMTRYQTRFRLEPVGEERDGSIVPIDQLSYRPNIGWGAEWPLFGNVADAIDRRRARRSVYRWYRIKCTAPADTAGLFQIPGTSTAVSALWQLLPLEPGLVQTEVNAQGLEQPRPAVVDGIHFPFGADGQNLSEIRRLTEDWRLDRQRGIVQFRRGILRRGANDQYEPAELYLTVAHPVRRSADRQPLRFERERGVAGAPAAAGVWIVPRADLRETVLGAAVGTSGTPSQNSANPERNTASLNGTADSLAAALEAGLTTATTADVEYAGLQKISPDGAIQQVEWSEGPEGAVTRASRNSEFATSVRPHARRRTAAREWN